MSDPLHDIDPAAALASMDTARAALLARVGVGAWRYDLIYAVLAAALVAGQALPVPLNIVSDAVVVVAMALLVRWWRAKTGLWVSGVTPRRARWVAVGVGLVAGVAALTVAITAYRGQPIIALPLAGAVGLFALAGSRLWRRVYRDELTSGALPDAGGGRTLGVRNRMWPVMGLGAVSILVAGVLLTLHVEAYIVGMFVGMGVALMASPALVALKRRVFFG